MGSNARGAPFSGKAGKEARESHISLQLSGPPKEESIIPASEVRKLSLG